MKKIIHKLKKNRLVSKITCFSVILMILISSLTVSSFAADEEVSSANEEVNSITDTWTFILNWITGSLSSVQNVFFTSASQTSGSITLTSNDGVYSADLGFIPSAGDSFTLRFTFFGDPVSLDFVFELDEGAYEPLLVATSSFGGYSLVIVNVPGSSIIVVQTDLPGDFNGSIFDYTYFSGSGSLTFLGTLAVIGVAFAIILLLVYVISRFIRLRG